MNITTQSLLFGIYSDTYNLVFVFLIVIFGLIVLNAFWKKRKNPNGEPPKDDE